MTTLLDEIIQVMGRVHNRDVSQYEEGFLAHSLEKRLAATGCPDHGAYLETLAENGTEAEAFHRSLNVTYSEFFRNPLTFALLEQWILPQLAAAKAGQAEIRVWSASCAAGQEPYSVAILLDELAATRRQPIPRLIFATDWAEGELAIARRGVYEYASVRNVRLKHVRDYFTRQDTAYAVVARLRDYLDFSRHDLLDPHFTSPPASIYGNFDLVLCSNLLLYYRPATQRLILDRLHQVLSPDGYLVTDEAEQAIVTRAGRFRAVAPPAAVFRKR